MGQHYQYLKQYYDALALVDQRYRELQAARTEMVWYEGKLTEANELAASHGLNKAFIKQSAPIVELNRDSLNRDSLLNLLNNFQELVNRLQLFQGNFQHQLRNIQNSYEAELRRLRDLQEKQEKQFKEVLSLLELAKKAVFFYLLTIVVITVLAAYISKSPTNTGITALVAMIGSAILPLFYGRGLFVTVYDIKQQSKNYHVLHNEVIKLRHLIPDEEARLLHNKRHLEAQLRAQLEGLLQEASSHLEAIQLLALSARYEATQVKPQRLREEWQKQQRIVAQLVEKLDIPLWNWQDKRWEDDYFNPDTQCNLFRIGDLFIDRDQGDVSIPAIVTLRATGQNAKHHCSGNVVIFSNNGDSRQAALQTMESLAVRAIASMPVRTCKGIFIDPVNAGNTFPFRNFPDVIVGKQTYTRSEDIREQLRALAQHVEQVIQNYLSRNYKTIEDYNSDTKAIAEAYRYVFVADFPSGFDRSAIEDLKSLLLNGARAGVYVFLHVDDTLEKPRDFHYELFDEWCTVLRPAYGLTTGGSFQRGGSFKVGYVYVGRVTRILHSGAFVEFLPGREGMLPTAQMTEQRIRYPEEAVSVGQVLAVKVNNIDGQDRATLTCLGIQGSEARSAACLAWQAEDFQYEGVPLFTLQLPEGVAFRIRLDTPPASELFNQLANKLKEAVKKAPIDVVKFAQMYPDCLWARDSRCNLSAPIGMAGAREKLEFLVGMYADDSYEPAHALLAGTTGSGKSFTLHAIIFSLALHYPPEELELYLLDYKEGVEFQIYVTPDRLNNHALNDPDPSKMLPHARVISIESDAEFGLSVLERAIEEIAARGKKFKEVGAEGLASYRKAKDVILPRILIAIDEYQQMYLQADSRLCDRLNDALETIAKQGRSFGVHLLLSSQSPRVKDFRERIYEQMAVRMGMKMSRSAASILMAEGNVDVVELLDRVGKIAYNDRLGEKGYNRIGQVASIDKEARIKAMKAILKASSDRGFQRSTPTVLFNGIQPPPNLSTIPNLKY